ncbi:MAG: Rrf2 family transcriptional regulator [Proteobacteria bacterium]|nr:Rrf2 family transcriptional regulator [Pseudomonadota bacterium]
MKISSRARHAVRLILEISRLGDGSNPVQLSEVAKITGLSRRFLEQLCILLKSHSLLIGVCGRNGGYLLARPSIEITIGDVLRAVIGPINLAVCAGDPTVCLSSEFCSSRMVWELLQKRINEVLDEYTIADLLDSKKMGSLRAQLPSMEQFVDSAK